MSFANAAMCPDNCLFGIVLLAEACCLVAVLDDGLPFIGLQVHLALTKGAHCLKACALWVGGRKIIPRLRLCDKIKATSSMPNDLYLERYVLAVSCTDSGRRCFSSFLHITYFFKQAEHVFAFLVLWVLLQAGSHVVVGILVLSQSVIYVTAEVNGIN